VGSVGALEELGLSQLVDSVHPKEDAPTAIESGKQSGGIASTGANPTSLSSDAHLALSPTGDSVVQAAPASEPPEHQAAKQRAEEPAVGPAASAEMAAGRTVVSAEPPTTTSSTMEAPEHSSRPIVCSVQSNSLEHIHNGDQQSTNMATEVVENAVGHQVVTAAARVETEGDAAEIMGAIEQKTEEWTTRS